MDYIKEYKNFIASHYLSEGVRMTAGIVLPSVILSYFHSLSTGIVVSLGAMSVGLTDTIGPIHHRVNGMKVCVLSIFLVSLLTSSVVSYPVLLGIIITVVCFIFSMIGVYGNRANSIGTSVLLVMVLSTEHSHQGMDNLLNALYILAGGMWYMLMSLALYKVRPFRPAQQALGDCIAATSHYLRTRAAFYDKNIPQDNAYEQVVQQQIVVQEKQNVTRELLFKTRTIVKDATDTGRMLVMIFRDMLDLFERSMTSYQNYEALHRYFSDSDLLEHFRKAILVISEELDDIALAVRTGNSSGDKGILQHHLNELHLYFDRFRDEHLTHENIEGFISLRHTLNGLDDIASRVHMLHLYTTREINQSRNNPGAVEYEKFITHTVIDLKLLRDNLTLQSNTFRHALRLSIATLAGYICARFLPLGHEYWILLTIIVILKPAYSLSKRRNYDRLTGTVAGGLLGAAILLFISNHQVLFALMLALMVITYSLFRINYLISVFFMTPYIMLLFHLFFGLNTREILLDRVIDTAIGSAVAFLANLFLIPVWEKDQIGNYMARALAANIDYFQHIAAAYTQSALQPGYKLKRKNAFVALANLSDAFARMLQEPKSKQINAKKIYQFVTLNHMLTSHIATLSYYIEPMAARYASKDFNYLTEDALLNLQQARQQLLHRPLQEPGESEPDNIIDKRVRILMEKRRAELQRGELDTETKKTLSEFKSIADQFHFIHKISLDIKRVSTRLVEETPAA